jgi:hypothetical protein
MLCVGTVQSGVIKGDVLTVLILPFSKGSPDMNRGHVRIATIVSVKSSK